ncbi:MAG: hypothetical protein L6406_23055, partial [Desulfobacterales bacterium]|nr:hypothetical protein [Desulfobacterales bacterium]
PADAAAIAISKINIGNDSFRLNEAILHWDRGPYGRTNALFTGLFQGLGILCTSTESHTVSREIQWTEFYMALVRP